MARHAWTHPAGPRRAAPRSAGVQRVRSCPLGPQRSVPWPPATRRLSSRPPAHPASSVARSSRNAGGVRRHPLRPDRHPRFRLAVHADHRPAGARGERVLRDPFFRRRPGAAARARAEGGHPLREPRVGERAGGLPRPRCAVRARGAGARHLLRHAVDGRTIRREGRDRRPPRVRIRAGPRARAFTVARRDRGPRERRGTWPARRVDEPRRSRVLAATRIQAHRFVRGRADRGDRRRGAGPLRRPVPSRGHPYPPGHAHSAPVRARHLRLRVELDPGRDHRRQHRAGAPGGGRRRRPARSTPRWSRRCSTARSGIG